MATTSQRVGSAICDTPSRTRITPSATIARNATLNLLTQGWTFLVLIVAMPKLVRSLGESSFGLFSLAWVMIGYLTFLDVGVNRAATKFISEHLASSERDAASEVVRTAIFANLAMGSLGGIVVALVSPFLIHNLFKVSSDLQAQANWTFYAVSFAVPVLLLQGIFRATLSSLQRFGWINAVDALASGVQWTVAGLLAWRGYGVALVVGSTVAVRLAGTVLYGFAVFALFPELRLFRPRAFHGLSKLLRFGSWVTISQLISPLLVYLDRVFLGTFVSLGAVTLYTVPFEATSRLRIIPTALVGTLYPAFSERSAESERQPLERLYTRSVTYLMLLLLPASLFLFLLGPDLFSIWMGPAFAHQTSTVVRILALGILPNALAPVPYGLLQALGRPDLTGKFHLLELPLYVALCLLLIPRWGLIGAAVAGTVRFALDSALLFWAAGRYCRCSLEGFWRVSLPRILVLNGLLALAMYAATDFLKSPWPRLGAGVLLIGVSLAASWNFVVESDDKPRLNGILKTFLGQTAREAPLAKPA